MVSCLREFDLLTFGISPGYYFNLRTRSLNNLLFQFIMIPAPLALSYVIDSQRSTRRIRGVLGSSIMGLITLGATAGLLGWIIHNNIDVGRHDPPGIDWHDPQFASGFVLYLLFGIVYATFQICVQWTLGSLTNDPVKCAYFSGAFKGTVSLGMCISFVMDSQKVSFQVQTITQLMLYVVGITSLLYVIWVFVPNTNYFTEDSVIVPRRIAETVLVMGTSIHEADVENNMGKQKADAANSAVEKVAD